MTSKILDQENKINYLKYGNKIKILNGMFEGCNGTFLINVKNNQSKIKVFFKTKIINSSENTKDYFKDYLFNRNIPEKIVSVIINISRNNIKRVD